MKTYPITQTQTGIYLADTTATGNANYNIDMLYHLDAEIDIDRLKLALISVINNHPYVKSRLVQTEEGELRMEDHSTDEPIVTIRETESLEAMRSELGKKFDLLNEPLYRLTIYKVGNAAHLYMDFHHIVFDGMSFANFRNELALAYDGETLVGETKDGFSIAMEEEELRKTEVYAEAKAWHEHEFGAASEVESLPRPDVYGKENAEGKWVFAFHPLKNTESEVKALCEKHGVGISIPFTAAFGYTLANFSADDEALYTTIFHGRSDKATRNAFTMMVKTLAVYHDFRKISTVGELLQQTTTQLSGTRKRTIYFFGELHQDLGIEPRVCFAYQGTLHTLNIALDGREQAGDDLRLHRPGLDFAVHVIQKGENYECKVEYNTAMYSAAFVEQFCKSYSKVLREMMCKEQLADIEFVDDEHIEQLNSFNQIVPKEFVSDTDTIVSCFREIARQYPDNIAVKYNDVTVTYRELDEKSDSLAAHISSFISGKDSYGVGLPIVSILIGRSENMVILPIAVQKANAAYQPLDPNYPQERLNFMVKDADAKLLIVDRELRPMLSEYNGDVIYTDEIATLPNAAAPASTLNPSSALIVLYTSGSTGVPKGVVLEHHNLVTYKKFDCFNLNITSESSVSAYASFGFDANMSDLYPTILTGATLVIIPEDIRLDLDAISEYFKEHNVTHCMFTTQVGYQFATAFPDHPTLRYMLVGGEKLAALNPPTTFTLINGYGPTECTCYATSKEVKNREMNIPIGHSNATAPCYIVNKHGMRLPVGAAGELIITGPQVSRGYLNRPDKTAEVFDAFHFGKGVRTYRTGDIVRYRENGDIEFVGRKDGQVKIRGFRIELKEIEAVIRDFDGIKDVTVQAFDLESGGKYIAAYIVSDEQIDIPALNDFILAQKPSYMVPAVTMQIETIPLNVNQKVDKKKLPKPELKSEEKEEENSPHEQNVLEQQLAELIGGLLGNTPGVATSLTYCGLSSILSMRLAALLFKKYGIRITSKELLAGATILTIENQVLNHLLKGSAVVEQQTITTVAHPSQALLSFSQQGVYADCLANPDSTIYNIPTEVKFASSVDTALLKKATETVFESHPILFANFTYNDENDIIQIIPENYTANVEVRELDGKTIDDIKADFLRPFDLSKDTLWRALIVHTEQNVILLMDIHHLVADGSSIDIIINQIVNALNGGDVIKESYTYLDFCESQRQFAGSKEFAEYKQFFAKQLSSFETITDILPDVSGKEVEAMAQVAVPLPEYDISKNINGVTDAHFWLAATAYALGRFANTKDVYFTAISSGRQNLDIIDTAGMFVNTLPISAHIKSQSVREYLHEVSDMFRDTIDHENYPFSQIAAEYGYTAGVAFAYQLGIIADKKVNGESISISTFGLDVPKFHIGIFFEMYDGKPCVVLQYDDSLYSRELMQSFSNSIVAAGQDMYGSIDKQIDKISICANVEQQIELGRGKALDYDRRDTIVSIFRRQAAATPNALCVVYSDRNYTYREVDKLTETMARHLASLGVKPEQPVGVMVDRSEKILLFPLAIMKAGGAYMPLDSHFPEDRLLFMCDDAGVKIILTEGDLLKNAMPSFTGKVLTQEDIMTGGNATLKAPAPENMHVILYTSGSTGKPKGVVLEQHNIVNFCHWFIHYYNVTADDRIAAFANFGFDVHQADLWPAISVGASIYIIPQDMRLDLAGLEEYINKNNLTIANITTQIGSMFATTVPQSSLHTLIVGGEKLGSTRKPNYDFYNAYGPTECTIYATCYDIKQDYDNSLIGYPLYNYSLVVVDENVTPLPAGALGELLIIGEGVGREYLNRPEVTAEKFITFNGERAYRTGDLVRMMPDGQIDYIGRMDGQVKLRGLRIELGEVENAILRHPAVKGCAAAVKEIAGTQHLCAYFVLKEGEDVSAEELKTFMGKSVTDFMVPDFMMRLDHLLYNGNGKVDRKQLPLPEPTEDITEDSAEDTHSWNKLELELKNIIAKLIGNDNLRATVPLRQYGLTSLLSMKLAVQLLKQYGVKLQATELAKGTLLNIEDAIHDAMYEKMKTNNNAASTSQDKSGSLSASSPLAYQQQGVYIDCIRNFDTTMYNMPSILTFPIGVKTEEIAAAVNATYEAHQSLSLTFGSEDGIPTILAKHIKLDISTDKIFTTDAEYEDYKNVFLRPFDLAEGPLVHAEVVTHDGHPKLMIDIHHLVADGSSLDIIFKEILLRMEGKDIDAETYSYTDYANQQNADKTTEKYEEAKAYYDGLFEEFETAAEIPSDKNGNADEGAMSVAVKEVDHEAVGEYAKKMNVTPAAIFLAATYYTIGRFTNSNRVYLGTLSNGRSNLDILNTTGMFVTTMPLMGFIGDMTVEEYVSETAENFIQAIKHENYPFLTVSSDYGFVPAIMYEYQMGVLEQYKLHGQEVEVGSMNLERPKFKISVKILEKGVSIYYNNAIYSHELMTRLAECIAANVTAIITVDSSKRIKHLSMLNDSMKRELDNLRQTCLDPGAVRFPLFHNGIEYWAEQTPDKTALIACDENLTYRQLNEKANVLAHSLMNKGVIPGDRICLLLPRRSWHIIAMFGVMKAGAAYIPCDPEYPAERIRLITEDSHARFVITTKDKMDEYGGRAVDVEALLAEDMPMSNPGIEQDSETLAYLIYTSGSTGRPKGVMLKHIGICNYLTDHEENRHFHALVNDCKTMLCITTVSFDLSLKEIGASLFNGMTLVFADEEQVNNPQALADLMISTGVDGFSGTPSRLKMFLDLPDFKKAFAKCKFIVLGGEKYPPTLLLQIKELAPNARLFNTYGPTEISVSCNGKELTHDEHITIGRPLLNVKEYVVDNDLNELPVGVTGELLIGGLGVAAGYNDLPEKTDEAFIEFNGERCYKSGDYAYWNPEGDIVILGRKDHQIKLNGLRIELGEVETVLNRQPQVKEGVVMIKNVEGHDHLVAYFVPSNVAEKSTSANIEILKEQMGKSLTHYMVPTIFVQMEKMPISPNGKTDLKAMPEPTMAHSEYVEPANDIERFFADTFANILGRERVGATDNFFEIGGTSLVAIRVVMAAMQNGYKIVYKQVFDNPTPRALAELQVTASRPNVSHVYNIPSTSSEAEVVNDGTDPEVQDYDYSAINELLKKNNLNSLHAEPLRSLGTCIVTGATGYLGIHVVKELIDNVDVPAIYCLVRSSKRQNAEKRFRTQLFYYFGTTYEELFGSRIFVIDGDITKPDCFDTIPETSLSNQITVFNCAANVKHFSAGTDIEDINIGGCQTCIDFCLKTGARLIQTSTHSIAGTKESLKPCQPDNISENRLYWGQKLGNQYAHAKFIAERNVLEAIVRKGLDGKIMRLGNLSARSTDGEFQINFTTNSFMGRLKAFQTIGCMSYQMAQRSIEFSPINEVAKAVVILSSTPKNCTVFHPVNAHRQLFDNIIVCLNRLGVNIYLVENDKFEQALNNAFSDPAKAPILQSLIAYQAEAGKYVVSNGDNYEYTTQSLLRLGFRWNFTSWDYMERFIEAIQGLGFFDEDYKR